jgi:cation diffusion facilitator family transporter
MRSDEFPDNDEDSQFSPAQRAAAASRSTWVSVAVNLVLSIAQIAVGVLAKSQALIADGIHTLSDLVADFVVLFANHHSQKDADEDHPYGHQRFETAASLVLGVLLLAVGLGMLWSAAGKLQNPASIAKVHIIALWVAAGALVAKELLFRYMLSVAKMSRAACWWRTPGTPARMPRRRWWWGSASSATCWAIPFWTRLPPPSWASW